MANWYYVRGEERVGPLSEAEMADLVASGALRPDTAVWSAGMTGWIPARDARLPGVLVDGDPAPAVDHDLETLPGTPGLDTAASAPAIHPWRRWLARLLDIGMFAFVVGVLAEVFVPGAAFLNWSTWSLNALLLLLWQPLEALLLNAIGTTPGKALLRISLSRDGFRLSYWTALQRSFLVWIRGLGAGLPLVSLFTLALSYNSLRNDGVTPWDSRLGVVVRHQPLSTGRWLVVAVAVALYVVLSIYGSLPVS